jgi:putative FmdB family regulatory protein
MPIYEVQCVECGAVEEIFRKIADREKNLPECHGKRMKNILSATMVNEDIKPYKAVAVDKRTGERPYITSRKAHKEFLRRNDYVELPSVENKPRPVRGDFDCKKELIQATKKVLSQS